MSVALTFTESIESDYSLFKDIMLKHTHFNCDTNEKLKVLHLKIYQFKELFSNITTNSESRENFLESINGQIEFIWLISLGKYKIASMAYRGAMENFSKGIASQLSLPINNKFAENIETSTKKTVEQITSIYSLSHSDKKKLGKEFRENVSNPFKQSYWDLCDIVHSRDQSFNTCKEFLDEILELKLDEGQLDILLDFIIKISNYILLSFYYSNIQAINTEINLVKLDLITSTFPNSFDSIKKFIV